MLTIFLGPQRFTTSATAALRSLDDAGPVATINAGWEEVEDRIGELDAALDLRARHLRLYHRRLDVIAADAEVAVALTSAKLRRDELFGLYRMRLGHSIAGVHALRRRLGSGSRSVKSAYRHAIGELQRLDAWYQHRVDKLTAETEDVVAGRDSVQQQRGEVAEQLQECVAAVLTGGNVATLLASLRLLDVRLPSDLPVIAWSAGAMALTERVVLFHDHGPVGAREAELWGRGLGRVPGVVALPHATERLELTDRSRNAVLAQRFADARCLLLDRGDWVSIDGSGDLSGSHRVLGVDGDVISEAAA